MNRRLLSPTLVALVALVALVGPACLADAPESDSGGAAGSGGSAGGSSGTGGGGSGASAAASGAGGNSSGGTSGAGMAGSSGATTGGSAGAATAGTTSAGGGGGAPCASKPGDDADGDGFAVPEDCNDCDPLVNPGAVDLVEYVLDGQGKPIPSATQVDDDCSGTPRGPKEDVSCDDGLLIDDADPEHAARALGLCQMATGGRWGLISAAHAAISGGFGTASTAAPIQRGIVASFGGATAPREGKRMLVLSTGQARAPGQAGYVAGATNSDHKQPSTFPVGFPKSGACNAQGKPFDGVALDVRVKVPTNAKRMRFAARYFTADYPDYLCTGDDVFAVLMSPFPDTSAFPADAKAAADKMAPDLVFVGSGAAPQEFGVNVGPLLSVCATGGKNPGCAGGGDLAGTGFEGHGATAWVQTVAPVTPGSEVFLRFALWDTTDGVVDSTVVLDDLAFDRETAASIGTGVAP